LTITQQFVTDRYVLKKPTPVAVEIAKKEPPSSEPEKPGKKKSSSPKSGEKPTGKSKKS
jgi:hypothetical protein